jgi:hypothetical protein
LHTSPIFSCISISFLMNVDTYLHSLLIFVWCNVNGIELVLSTTRNHVHTDPHVCDLHPNQRFLQLLMWLSFVAPCKNDLRSHMWLWIVTTTNLDENKNDQNLDFIFKSFYMGHFLLDWWFFSLVKCMSKRCLSGYILIWI